MPEPLALANPLLKARPPTIVESSGRSQEQPSDSCFAACHKHDT